MEPQLALFAENSDRSVQLHMVFHTSPLLKEQIAHLLKTKGILASNIAEELKNSSRNASVAG